MSILVNTLFLLMDLPKDSVVRLYCLEYPNTPCEYQRTLYEGPVSEVPENLLYRQVRHSAYIKEP